MIPGAPMPQNLSLKGGDAGPSNASSPFNGQNTFDNSGWNVNFGEGNIESSAKKSDSGLMAYMPYAALAIAGLVAWKMFKKS
jgi:hypothetical protein